MRLALQLFLCLIGTCSILGANEPSEAPKFKLLYFTAEWCGPCRMMQQQTWPSPDVQIALSKYQLQKIDIDQNKELANKWSVRSIPSFIVTGKDPDLVLARIGGFMNAEQMQAWLIDTLVSAAQIEDEQQSLKAIYINNSKQLKAFQNASNQTEIDQAFESLYALLKLRSALSEQQAAEVQASLMDLSRKFPDQLIHGLLQDDIQVRVYVSRALSTESVYLDPWASRTKREEMVATYARKTQDRSGDK